MTRRASSTREPISSSRNIWRSWNAAVVPLSYLLPLLILASARSPSRKTHDYRDHGVNVITGLARLNCRACADIG
jgi:hypothetical protein